MKQCICELNQPFKQRPTTGLPAEQPNLESSHTQEENVEQDCNETLKVHGKSLVTSHFSPSAFNNKNMQNLYISYKTCGVYCKNLTSA